MTSLLQADRNLFHRVPIKAAATRVMHFALRIIKRNVYWSRPSVCLSVCVSVCLSLAACLHYRTYPDVT